MRSVLMISFLSVAAIAMPFAAPAPDATNSSRRTAISQEELDALATKTGKTVDEISQALYGVWETYKLTDEDIAALAASKIKRGQISEEELEEISSKTGKTVDEISQALYGVWETYKLTDEDLAALAASKK